MPDDAPSFLNAARAVVMPITAPPRTDRQNFSLIFTSQDHADAISAGFERAEHELGEDGGFSVAFDGRGAVPTEVLNGSDGEITVCGHHAIRELAEACSKALAMSARMTGRV